MTTMDADGWYLDYRSPVARDKGGEEREERLASVTTRCHITDSALRVYSSTTNSTPHRPPRIPSGVAHATPRSRLQIMVYLISL